MTPRQRQRQRVERRPPELCLIDWNMPVLDGYSFVSAVRKNPEWRNITLMMVTTESSHDQIVRALAAGAKLETAAHFANAAAGVVVGKLGTATVTPQELLAYVNHR